MQFPFVTIGIFDWIVCRLSNIYAGSVLILSMICALYYSLLTIFCEHRIFQIFQLRMGVFATGVDSIDSVYTPQILFSYLAVCVVVHCLLTGIVMHIHACCVHITLESGNITHSIEAGAKTCLEECVSDSLQQKSVRLNDHSPQAGSVSKTV